LFERLRGLIQARGDDFELWVSGAEAGFARRGTEGRLDWAVRLPVFAIPGSGGKLEWQQVCWADVLTADVMVIPDNLRVLSTLAILFLRQLRQKPVLVWGHGVNFQPDWFGKRMAGLRVRLLRLADRYLVYTDACIPPMRNRGFTPDRIVVIGNAIDSSEARGLTADHPEVRDFRRQHGLADDPCLVFLGSWYRRKRPERILEIGAALRIRVPNARVVVIGGGDGLEVLSRADCGWLTVLGPLTGRDKFVALAAARCLAVTGIAGLNLLDAMAVGLPVVAPIRTDHSPEIAYIRDDINGLLVEDRIEAIADRCARLMENLELQAQMSRQALETVAQLTVDEMAQRMREAIMDTFNPEGNHS
jgi:glycosyltransferase involved in cell wall biosynthesis